MHSKNSPKEIFLMIKTTVSTGNYIQYLVISYKGEESEEESNINIRILQNLEKKT